MFNKVELLKMAAEFYNNNKDVINEKINSLKGNIDLETIYGEFIKDTFKTAENQTESKTVKNDVYELKRFYGGLYMEVPGFSKDNVDITVDKKTNTINIRGKFTLMLSKNETQYKDFEVSYTLDKDEVIDKVSLENGLLTIFLKPVEKEITKIIIE